MIVYIRDIIIEMYMYTRTVNELTHFLIISNI